MHNSFGNEQSLTGDVGIQASADGKMPWRTVKDSAAKTAFVLNQWKNVAENSRNLGWTSSSEEAMIKLRREGATADAMKHVVPMLMKRATVDKTIQETGNAPAGIPDEITNLGVTWAISVGSGSACALYYKSPDNAFYHIDYIVANTAMAGQLASQCFVVQEVVREAKVAGVPEVRLSCTCCDEMTGTIYGSADELGFLQPDAGVPWRVFKQ